MNPASDSPDSTETTIEAAAPTAGRPRCAVRGVVFDLDGTLIDSRLDFDRMRREMELPDGQPILEGIDALTDAAHAARCLEILHRHEHEGAQGATLMPGARELLDELDRRGIAQGILTRNSREMTDLALARLGLTFSQVVTREDAPPKPDPAGLLAICRAWGVRPREVLFVGDFRFDLLTGRSAGTRTVLYAPGPLPEYAALADFVADSLASVVSLIESP